MRLRRVERAFRVRLRFVRSAFHLRLEKEPDIIINIVTTLIVCELLAYKVGMRNTSGMRAQALTHRMQLLCAVMWCGVVWCGVVCCGMENDIFGKKYTQTLRGVTFVEQSMPER